MVITVLSYYYFIKIVFFYQPGPRPDQVRPDQGALSLPGDPLHGRGGVPQFVFIVSWKRGPVPLWQVRVARTVGIYTWQSWLGETFLLSTLYFWLMAKFDEGVIFWTLLLLGLLVVWF